MLTIAAILSFLLNYPVRSLERVEFKRVRFTRNIAITVVLLITLTLLIVLGTTLVPTVIEQTTELFKNIPDWLRASNQNINSWDRWAKAHRLPLDLREFSNRINTGIESQLQAVATQVVGFALGTVSGLLDFVLVVVLAFYMLLYGDRLWQSLIDLLPSQVGAPFSESLQLNFRNFFISQLLLGLFMVITLTPIFLFLKVQFPLLFPLLIGLGELIPFIGATLGIGLVTILVMIQNFKLALVVAAASIVMQQVKDNILAPKLMGDFIGLNPILIFIALLMGVQIAGLLGVIVAVPIAGTIKGTIDIIRKQRQLQVMGD
ncbi:MAG: AI-2E family transporter [Chamaesiphon sp.]